MPRAPEDVRRLLCALGEHVREILGASRGMDMAAVAGETVADTIYAIDRVADETLVQWFEQHWPEVQVVSEGLDQPVVVGEAAAWTVIVDTIDGTRGLMYDKRPAWCLAAAAPPGGGLGDIVAAAMTELPTVKQGAADQLSATRGGGLQAERLELRGGERSAFEVRPSAATDLEHSFSGVAKFFLPGKTALVGLEAELFRRLGARQVFDDEYLSTGGQLHELITGRDRFVADLRPLVQAEGLACHPYDVCTAMLLEEVGGVVTDPWGTRWRCRWTTCPPWPGSATPTGLWRRGSGRCWPNWWTACVRGQRAGTPGPPRRCGRLLGGARVGDADPPGHRGPRPSGRRIRRRPRRLLFGRADAVGRPLLRGRPPESGRVAPLDALCHRRRHRARPPRGDRRSPCAARDHLGPPLVGGRGLRARRSRWRRRGPSAQGASIPSVWLHCARRRRTMSWVPRAGSWIR